jgi:carbon starvation protein
MNLLGILILSALGVAVAYRVYGGLLARLLKLDDSRPTPAVAMRDDRDYVPIEWRFLISQHFSAIAAAGPIVGPILAGLAFGWGPALAWILLGSIFIGGVHDMASLVASVRHQARSIADVVGHYMSRRSYLLFLFFIWVALVYIIVAFTDVVASQFVGEMVLDDGVTKVTGGGVASSSLMYLALPIVMGLLLRYTRLSLNWATVIFLPLVGVAIWAGEKIPFDLARLLSMSNASAIKTWDVLLLVYCLIAGVMPVWMLLQPRGHLGGFFLFIALLGSGLGILVGGIKGMLGYGGAAAAIEYPAFIGFTSAKGEPLLPLLFITIACGACSGFHCLIASGTTSKQLQRESDAKKIGYGAMLLEALVSVVSLGCVMMLAKGAAATKLGPNGIYANGLATYLAELGIPRALGYSFGMLAFTTFVYDTLDVCTRLGRYIIQELTGWKGMAGAWLATGITAGVPLIFVMQTVHDAAGKPVPAWRLFWSLFGASNQLLAALALLGLTVWLWATVRRAWVWFVVGLPGLFMYTMSVWSLTLFVREGFWPKGLAEGFAGWPRSPVPYAAAVLLALAALIAAEAGRSVTRRSKAPAEALAV